MGYYHTSREVALSNENFRHVVYTAEHIQIVLMNVPGGQEIGEEVHEQHDQTFVFVAGEGKVTVGSEKLPVHPGDLLVIPMGVYHNVKSLGPEPLKLYSFCTPPHHPSGTIYPTKASATTEQEH